MLIYLEARREDTFTFLIRILQIIGFSPFKKVLEVKNTTKK